MKLIYIILVFVILITLLGGYTYVSSKNCNIHTSNLGYKDGSFGCYYDACNTTIGGCIGDTTMFQPIDEVRFR